MPRNAVCNPITSNADNCSEADVALIPQPGDDPFYVCDIAQCPLAPPAADRTTVPPSECKDDDDTLRKWTNHTCKEVNTVYPQACYDTSNEWYDFARKYVGVHPLHMPPTRTSERRTQFDPRTPCSHATQVLPQDMRRV
jgi:hypothetical protein